MYRYEYFSEETLEQARDWMVEHLLDQIATAERKLEYLQSKEFKEVMKIYNRQTNFYIRIAQNGGFTREQLDRVADKIEETEDTLRNYLAIDGWYIGKMDSIELPEV